MPSRKIPINSRVVTGYFYSVKNKRTMEYESLVERDYYLALEYDDSVMRYEEQPFAVVKRVDAKDRTYYPDCFITFYPETCRRPLLVEVKSKGDLNDPKKALKLKFKIEAIEEYARENGMDFKLVLDTEIRGQRLNNLKFLYRNATSPKTFELYKQKISEALQSCGVITVCEILDAVAQDKTERALILPSIWHLLSRGVLKTDLNIPLTNSSVLEVDNEKNNIY